MDEKIYIGSDHSGFRLKEELLRYLASLGIPFVDMGNIELQPNDDYPDYALSVAEQVSQKGGCGILCSDNGMNMCAVANKVISIRATHILSADMAKWAREELDANVLCLSQEYTDTETMQDIVRAWLETGFIDEERFTRRLGKIDDFEKGNSIPKKSIMKTIKIIGE